MQALYLISSGTETKCLMSVCSSCPKLFGSSLKSHPQERAGSLYAHDLQVTFATSTANQYAMAWSWEGSYGHSAELSESSWNSGCNGYNREKRKCQPLKHVIIACSMSTYLLSLAASSLPQEVHMSHQSMPSSGDFSVCPRHTELIVELCGSQNQSRPTRSSPMVSRVSQLAWFGALWIVLPTGVKIATQGYTTPSPEQDKWKCKP